MLTIFTIPKPFTGENVINQCNAILSWKHAINDVQIILWGDEEGVEEYSNIFNVEYGGIVPRNKFNTPLISEVFERTKKIAKNQYLMYVNADIILLDNLNAIISNTLEPLGKITIVCGRRIDCNLNRVLDFSSNWIQDLETNCLPNGKLHSYSGIDYFLFPKSLPVKLKPFAVGRPGWDNWFLYYAKKNKILILDASNIVTAIHQNHKPAYTNRDIETKENQKMLRGFIEVANIYHSDYILNHEEMRKPNLLRRFISFVSTTFPFSYIFAGRRWYLNSNKKYKIV